MRTVRPTAALLALCALLALLLVPAHRAAASSSPCALAGTTGWMDEGHDTDRTRFQQPLGTKRVLMLYVDFSDAPADAPTANYGAQITPAADWMWQASYGRTWLAITQLPRWLRMPQPSTSYGYQRGISFEQHELYVRQAVEAADPYVDFSQYDLVYVVPPRTASAISFTPTYVYDPTTAGVSADGSRIKWAVTFGQDLWYWGPKIADHETGHTFGLPDLYGYDGADIHRYVGGWDLMGKVGGPAPEYFGWEAWKLGWLDEAQVACVPGVGQTTVPLTAVEYVGGTKIVVLKLTATLAYVVESRRAAYADRAPCSTGVVVYRVDTSVATGEGAVQVMNGNPGAAVPAGCTALDLAALQPGQTFTDPYWGVRVEVLSGGTYGDTVRATSW
ncbi:peptidase M6 [Kitasatospora sp. MMS16-BH015]|uniref:M6 family metalloprotease domain-containing protein n=1 Tax=Kitasatospora sp. MMS16-BH015 TaxID=2018025 RepID=UPI000CA357C4|nr:M6 family metalloprotease domain-containing protein [Kitasatospora sp. MMS16-BH015]AUG77080.1 peptidase M6 [Kitasatospora sp. MMS16-BH015]